MTILSSSQSLLDEVRHIFKTDRRHICNDLRIIGSNGSYLCPSLLLASISPILQRIGKDSAIITEEKQFALFLPDFNVSQIISFVSQLTCNQEPANEFDTFLDILLCLGYNSNIMLGDSSNSDFKSEQLEPEEYEGDEDGEIFVESDPDDDVYKENRKGKVKNRRSRRCKEKSGKIRAKVQKCFDSTRNIYACFVCGTERSGGRSIQQHLLWHERHPQEDFLTCHICQECGKVCADYNAKKFHVRQVHCDRTLACSYEGCGKVFKTQVALKSHLDIHAGVKNYVCAECGFAFRSKQEIKGHVLRKHSNVKKSIPCELCGKIFRHMSNLKSHLNIHKAQSERQHRCNECNLTFKSELTLKTHMILHDPSRPFKCSKCPLRYKNKDAWVSHESSHDNPQYSCELCDVSYTRKDNLKRHMKDKHMKLNLTADKP